MEFTGGLLDPFQEMPYRLNAYLGFPGFREPVQGIQGVALHQFREKLAEGLLMAEAFKPYHPSTNCKRRANLAIYQPEGLKVLPKPVFLPLKEVGHSPVAEWAAMRSLFIASSFQIMPWFERYPTPSLRLMATTF